MGRRRGGGDQRDVLRLCPPPPFFLAPCSLLLTPAPFSATPPPPPALWQRLLWTGEHTLSAGWGALYGAYARESGACAPLLALLVTDGPPRDAAALGAALGAQGGAHLLVALFGEGPDHDAGWAAWCALAAANPRVRALSFAGETSAAAAAESVCRQLLH